MPFFSTRSATEAVTFDHAVIEGLAPDGGLYIPQDVPHLNLETLREWSSLSFQDLATEIFCRYVSSAEIPRSDIAELVQKSYSTFRDEEVTPLRNLSPERNLHLLELFHGPTYAFKDVALQFLGNLFEYLLTRRNVGIAENSPDRQFLTVIGATSGDTGSAAIYGLRNKKDVSVFILYPEGRVSPIQEQQMTTVLDKNVHTITVPGDFDDCQDLVKQMFADEEFNNEYHVGAVNSINWARILAQITYYFASYFRLARDQGARVGEFCPSYVVPTGNFGDILAGYYAKRMGLPIKLVVATNANDILYRFLQTGSYTKEGSVHATLSPAMDIVVSSNFERFLWHAARDTVAKSNSEAGALVAKWMAELKATGSFTVPSEVHALARATFQTQHSGDEETVETIRKVYRDIAPSYILDPHSAVAVAATLKQQLEANDRERHYIALATAHPAKFAEAVNRALSSERGYEFERDVLPQEFKAMMAAETKKIIATGKSKLDIQKIVKDEIRKEGKH